MSFDPLLFIKRLSYLETNLIFGKSKIRWSFSPTALARREQGVVLLVCFASWSSDDEKIRDAAVIVGPELNSVIGRDICEVAAEGTA